jgi:transposase
VIPSGTKVYFAVAPADLRKSFDGLAALCMNALSMDPSQGGLFVFINSRGNQVRVLFVDAQGWCLLSKRLDSGRFRRPQICSDGTVVVQQSDVQQLMAFLDDVVFPTQRSRAIKRTTLRVVQTIQNPTIPLS